MAQWPTDEELLSAVRDAGWLLEHNALRVLDAADMHPRAGWAFADPDEPTKSRELDVWSYRQLLNDEATKVRVTARILVECKQSSNPYVGIGYHLPESRFRQSPAEHVLPRQTFRSPLDPDTGSYQEVQAWAHLGSTNSRVSTSRQSSG